MAEKGHEASQDVKKKPGRPRKERPAKKSPAKKDVTVGNEVEHECPCKQYIAEEITISCENCSVYWHLCCVGLKGLTEEMVNCIVHWDCPKCFYSPHARTTVPMPNETSECRTMKTILKEELHLIQPVIRVTVEDAIRRTLSDSVCTKKDVDSAIKSYAEITTSSQMKVLEEASIVNSSQNVVMTVVRKLDSNKIEREKRKLNVVIMKTPESKADSAGQRQLDDYNFCYSELGLQKNEIDKCWRAGKRDPDKPDFCIRLVDEDTVDFWTDSGKGYKTDTGYWVNQDLCEADRKVSFLARDQRRKRQKSNNP